MAGYFDPQYGWTNTGGRDETMPLPTGLRRAAEAIFSPGDPRAEASAAAGADPRFRFDPSERLAAPPPPVVAAPVVASSVAPPPPVPSSGVIHEAGYRPDSFPVGDVRAGFSIDRSRGDSGMSWAADPGRRHGDSEVVRAPSTGPHTQGELEGMANAKRMLDLAYGPTGPAFDPNKARIDDLTDQANLRLAETRAADPVAFAELQAELPERAKTRARIAGGNEMAGVFGKFDSQLADLEAQRAAMRASPQYQAATKEGKEAAEARINEHVSRVSSNLRVLQQAMGFVTGQTPSTLYANSPI